LLLGGVRFELGAVQRDAAHFDHAKLHSEVQRLSEVDPWDWTPDFMRRVTAYVT
jgi:hypothetical protein